MSKINSFVIFIIMEIVLIVGGIILFVITYFNRDIWGVGKDAILMKMLIAGISACAFISLALWIILFIILFIVSYLDKRKERKNPGVIV